MSSSPPTRRCCLKQKHRVLEVGVVVQDEAQAGSEGSSPSRNPSREVPQKREGEKAEGTEESKALHMSAGKIAIADARSASALPLHRALQDRVCGVTLLSGNRHPPALHPSRSGSGGGSRATVSAAPLRPRGDLEAAFGVAAAFCRGFSLLTVSLYYRKAPR